MIGWNRTHGVSLRDLFPGAEFCGARDILFESCSSDSRRVRPGDLFVALPGVECDGHDFAHDAVQHGAKAVLVERQLPLAGIPQCIVPDVRMAYGHLCHALVDHPSRHLHVTGITGTNGKTTTAALMAGILRAADERVGTIGTLGINDGFETVPAMHTTPPAAAAAHWLAQMVGNGCTHAVMEVSSHALSQSRVAGIEFDAVCFTNIRRDHLDYHGSLVNYRRMKARLFEHLSPHGVALLNVDDAECVQLLERSPAPVITFAIDATADVTATVVERCLGEQTFLLHAGQETAAVRTRMIGDHHVYNCLAAAALGIAKGIDLLTIARGLEAVAQVPGRMERLDCGQSFDVIVDYAHTPDALQTCLKTLREVTTGRVLCVFGAGGDRDPRKRPLMGAAVERNADVAIITTDNPRSELPETIARDIREGFNQPSQVQVILDREQAIQQIFRAAQPGDSVLIAGKGHETYQVIGRQQYYFDDREVARDALYRLAPTEVPLWVRS